MGKGHHRFGKESETQTVRLVEMSGRTQRETAADLGIGRSRVRNWLAKRRDRKLEALPPEQQEDVSVELKQLRRENEIIAKSARACSGQQLFSLKREVDEVPLHRSGEEGVPHLAPVQGPRHKPERHLRLEEQGTMRNFVCEAGSPCSDEPLAEDNGELCLGLDSLARRAFPFCGRVVENEI